MQERTPLELVAFAAWVNCPVDKLPDHYKQHTCEATMVAWKRVVEAVTKDARAALEPVANMHSWTESVADGEVVIMTVGTVRKLRAAYEKYQFISKE